MIFRVAQIVFFSAPLAAAADLVTFDDHVFPLFQQACLNCHNPDKAKGGLDLSSYSATLKGGSGGKIVEPGDPGSKIVSLVLHSAEPKMPPEGEKIPAAQVEILKQWIEGGLLETKNSAAKKAAKPKFSAALTSDPGRRPDGPPLLPVDVLLEPAVVTPRAAAVHALAVSPWAPLLAITGQRQVLLHDTTTLELVGILPFPEGDPVSLAFTPDSRYLIVGGGVPGKSGVTVTFDVTNGSRLLSAAKEFDSILAADINPGFDIVATGGPSKLVKLWKTETGELITSIKKHTDWITALDISNDGVLLASGDRNGGVWVWETDTGSEYQTLRAHQAAITGLVFRADSNILASASEDGTVRIWEMNGGSEVKKIDAHSGGVTAFSFARDGSFLTAGRDQKAKLWKADFAPLRELAGLFPALPTAVAMDSDHRRAFVADALGMVRVFETDEGKLVGEILSNPPTIQARLRTLAELASHQQQAISTAEAASKDAADALEVARKALADAEKNHQQSIEIHRAAATGLQKAKDELEASQTSAPSQSTAPAFAAALEMASKNADIAQARLKPAEEVIAPLCTAAEAAQKAVADAAGAIETINNELLKIRSAEKHWSAAAINAQALEAASQAEQSTLESDGELDRYTAAILALEPQAAALSAKREQQQTLRNLLKRPNVAEPFRIEIAATLAALEISADREATVLKDREAKALALRDAVDQKIPITHQAATLAAQLKVAYEKARQ